VRASQATKDLTSFLFCERRSDLVTARQLLVVILGFARSEKLKVAANALRALGFFLAEADFTAMVDEASRSAIKQIVQA